MPFPTLTTWIDQQLFGYNAVASNGTAAPKRYALNFLPPLVATDNPSNGSTDVTVTQTASITSGALSALPTEGTAGRVYLPTDAPALYGDNGSSWLTWGPLVPLVKPPAAASFTWLSQSTGAVASDNNAGLLVTNDPAHGIASYLIKANTNVTAGFVEACIRMNAIGPQTGSACVYSWGLILYDATTAEALVLTVYRDISTTNHYAFNYYGAHVGGTNIQCSVAADGPLILKAAIVSGNIVWSVSTDRVSYLTVATIAIATALPSVVANPSHFRVGITVNIPANYTSNSTLIHYLQG